MHAVLALTIMLTLFSGSATFDLRAQETTTTTGFGVPTEDGEGRRIDGNVVVGGEGVELDVGTDRGGFDTPVPLALIFLGIGVVALGAIGIVIRRFGEM